MSLFRLNQTECMFHLLVIICVLLSGNVGLFSGDGPSHVGGSTRDRSERFWRRSHPGGGCIPGRLCRHLPGKIQSPVTCLPVCLDKFSLNLGY